MRQRPNILITGTPGTGKTTTAQQLAQSLDFNHIEVGVVVKEKGLHDGFDEEFQSYLINEDRVVDELEPIMEEGGNVVDHHSSAFFPERWFDLVICLQCPNDILYDRLEKRGYSQLKIQENIQCEIMNIVAEEAMESYEKEIIQILPSSCVEDMQENVERIEVWAANFMKNEE